MSQFKEIARDCVRAVGNKIDSEKRLHNFEVRNLLFSLFEKEIFGLDFMLDI